MSVDYAPSNEPGQMASAVSYELRVEWRLGLRPPLAPPDQPDFSGGL